MNAVGDFVGLLRGLGLIGASVDAAFEQDDLNSMQTVYDQACVLRKPIDAEERNVIAKAIVDTYKSGERAQIDLLAAAMTAGVE